MAEPTPDPSEPSATRVLAGGFFMGLANLVPGVSGGTMILALGLYDRFIGAIADVTRLRLSRASLLFLGLVALGGAITILGLSGVAVGLVRDHRWIMYSLFIGMTLGGAPELLRHCKPLTPGAWISFALSLGLMAALAWGLSGAAIPATIPVFLGMGALAASSMILPGISGSYMLLIFGMYDTVIGSLSASAIKEDPGESLRVIVPVVLGAGLGMALLSNLLKVLLARYRQASHAALLGLLVGSVLGLWPFRVPVHEDLAQKPFRKAVTMLVDGASLEQVEEKYELGWDEATAAELRARYEGLDGGDLKRLGDELKLFDPTLGQIAGSLGLLLVGVLITRLLGREGPLEEDEDEAASP